MRHLITYCLLSLRSVPSPWNDRQNVLITVICSSRNHQPSRSNFLQRIRSLNQSPPAWTVDSFLLHVCYTEVWKKYLFPFLLEKDCMLPRLLKFSIEGLLINDNDRTAIDVLQQRRRKTCTLNQLKNLTWVQTGAALCKRCSFIIVNLSISYLHNLQLWLDSIMKNSTILHDNYLTL